MVTEKAINARGEAASSGPPALGCAGIAQPVPGGEGARSVAICCLLGHIPGKAPRQELGIPEPVQQLWWVCAPSSRPPKHDWKVPAGAGEGEDHQLFPAARTG